MGFFGDYKATRRDERELGDGVWRRAHDRFKRGLDRYHQILESVRDPELRAAAVPVANELAELLPRVRVVCMDAHVRAPSQTQDIPHSSSGYLSDVHRQLSRAGNAMAQTAEALTMARFSASGVARRPASDGPSEPDGARVPAGSAAHAPDRSHATANLPTDAALAPLESPSTGGHSIRRRSAVVGEYVTAAEDLMAAHDPSRA